MKQTNQVTEDSDKIRLIRIENLLLNQNLYLKSIFNFSEACKFLDTSASSLYKLTSQKKIPHFCPNGKRLFFKREDLEQFLLSNRVSTEAELDKKTIDFNIQIPRV